MDPKRVLEQALEDRQVLQVEGVRDGTREVDVDLRYEVRRHRQTRVERRGGDAAPAGDAEPDHVGLWDPDRAAAEVGPELVGREERLAGRERDRGGALERGEAGDIVRRQRLL